MRRSTQGFALALGMLVAASFWGSPSAGAQAISARAAPASASPPSASPADVALAEKYAADAFEAYGRKAFAEAVALYQRALAAAPSADILYNLARVYDLGLGDHALAIDYYARYAAHPRAVPSRVQVAQQRSGELRAAEAARAEAARLDAIVSDFPPEGRRAPLSTGAQDARSFRALQVAALAVGSAGLVGVGLGIGFGLSARAQTDEWRRYCNGDECTSQRGVEAAQSAARKASVATLGFTAGGALLALGTVLWLADLGSERPAGAARLELLPVASSSDVGCSVSGRF